ncbi:MAG: magnesium/cobalt transporter CorA [Akkermansiaceae bacterium]|nr:magnesium/cobalt transporter CorA [Akkermansiaceae bacterium]MCP5551169.1 magnesium/cobalt transporter CorA [Akkermansiaceae bacterium]
MKRPRRRAWLSYFEKSARRPRHRASLGAPPGSPIHIGERRLDETRIALTIFDRETVERRTEATLEDCARDTGPGKIRLIEVMGLHDTDRIVALCEHFRVPSLIQEDILNTSGRSKIEEHAEGVYIITRLLTHSPDGADVDVQHLAVLLLPGETVLTFREAPTTAFDPVHQRIDTGKGRIRRSGADYLLWALIDMVVDHYLQVTVSIDETLARLEESLETTPEQIDSTAVFAAKKDINHLHRGIRPIREIATALYHPDSDLVRPEMHPFFRDLHDHAIQAVEASEDLRETAASLRDFYLSSVSNRMNEIMKVLTCFSAIFLPLTFLAGIYGMNFRHMPELDWPLAYPALWIAFGLISAVMFWFFRRKRWL